MKTQSLTQWSNLYSSALKYSIPLYSSLLPRVVFASFAYVAVVVCVGALLFTLNPSLILWFFVGAITLLVCMLAFVNTTSLARNRQVKDSLQEIVIQVDGVVELNHHAYTLHLNSRVGLFGCWLHLEGRQGIRKKRETLFIAKNSVSMHNYCRLCRLIKRNSVMGNTG